MGWTCSSDESVVCLQNFSGKRSALQIDCMEDKDVDVNLNSWHRIFFEMLIVAQLVSKYSGIKET